MSSLDLGKETFTHQDITEVGILRAVAAYFEENPRPESPVGKGELTGLAHITARKLFDRYYGGKYSAAEQSLHPAYTPSKCIY